MNISARYRELAADVAAFAAVRNQTGNLSGGLVHQLQKAVEELASLAEQVGEIPQFKLERELTPVLLKAHGYLDRARLLFEEGESGDGATQVWELEQRIYRLLNDL
jgi:hypothetical protein